MIFNFLQLLVSLTTVPARLLVSKRLGFGAVRGRNVGALGALSEGPVGGIKRPP